MWFEKLTGFTEKSPEYVRENLSIEGSEFISNINNKRFAFGHLETPTLEQLRNYCPDLSSFNDHIKVSEVIADVQELHCDPKNENALFQAASQFNLLEMANSDIVPEKGVGIYEQDGTQGPACAIACGAGTIYRNYFAEVNGRLGQTADNQIDCLDLMGKEFNNDTLSLWKMKNGYVMANENGLVSINKIISDLTESQRESLKNTLRVGIQWNSEVTITPNRHKVSQIYCSALPVTYNKSDATYWESFSRIILEATYEATLYAGVLNMVNNGSSVIYLTSVGGGVFGNKRQWILESIQRALTKFQSVPLDIRIVSYNRSNPELLECIDSYRHM